MAMVEMEVEMEAGMKYTKAYHEALRIALAQRNFIPLSRIEAQAIWNEIERLQAENGWIPVSERLPLPAQKSDGYCSDSSDLVHVYPRPSNDRAVCYLHYLEKWSCSAEVNVTHWRPLPQPPEVIK